MTNMTIPIAHLSDSHVGLERYRATTPHGVNQRGADTVASLREAVTAIDEWDPPLVIHSGDIGERPTISDKYRVAIKVLLLVLAGIRPDGTRRQVVVIAGNHDIPTDLREPCWLELLAGLPGVHIVTSGYEQITFTGPDVDPILRDVVVHAVPHDSLADVDLVRTVKPIDGKVNVATFHGVASSSELFIRAVGREFPIPTDVLAQDWEYVALGHWHACRPVRVTPGEGPSAVWYAGSGVICSFADVDHDVANKRHWLAVDLHPGQLPDVERRAYRTRTHRTLPPTDVTDLGPDAITDALMALLERYGAKLDEAIVRIPVVGARREVWALSDIDRVLRAARERCLHVDVDVEWATAAQPLDPDADPPPLGDVGQLLEAAAAEQLREELRGPAVARARDLHDQAVGDGYADDTIDESAPTSIAREAA